VPAGLPVETVRPQGDAAPCLEEASANLDLLLMGSRGYGALRRVLLGGVSAKLMRSAHSPLLVLPRGAGDDPLASPPTSRRLPAWKPGKR
jgi:nucleotide-binding universal stress UspA family protein